MLLEASLSYIRPIFVMNPEEKYSVIKYESFLFKK